MELDAPKMRENVLLNIIAVPFACLAARLGDGDSLEPMTGILRDSNMTTDSKSPLAAFGKALAK